MRYFLDTEFIEHPPGFYNGRYEKGTIDLISIGIVSENGDEYYAIHDGFNPDRASDWVKEKVINKLEPDVERKSLAKIREEIIDFVDRDPTFYAYFADYDWVVFCWIFGSMVDLPHDFPKYCLDIKQIMKMMRVEWGDLPKQEGGHHNALDDARWCLLAYKYLSSKLAFGDHAGIWI